MVFWYGFCKVKQIFTFVFSVLFFFFVINLIFSFLESLTDEEAKKNWEEYGNPDGPQGNFVSCTYKFLVYSVCS